MRNSPLARSHSNDMISRGYFSHDTPEGLGPSDRANRMGYTCQKGSYYGIAENIWMLRSSVPMEINTAIALNHLATQAVEGWMESPGHRTNLLSPQVDRTGVGASLGRWDGSFAVILTQVFC